MSPNTDKQVIVGYVDELGHAYCIRHGSDHYDGLTKEDVALDQCEVCGKFIGA